MGQGLGRQTKRLGRAGVRLAGLGSEFLSAADLVVRTHCHPRAERRCAPKTTQIGTHLADEILNRLSVHAGNRRQIHSQERVASVASTEAAQAARSI